MSAESGLYLSDKAIAGLWVIVLWALTACSPACTLQVPPVRFATGFASVVEVRVSLNSLAVHCPVPESITVGCAFAIALAADRKDIGADWLIWLPTFDTVHGCSIEKIRDHEYAHARGWPASHPL